MIVEQRLIRRDPVSNLLLQLYLTLGADHAGCLSPLPLIIGDNRHSVDCIQRVRNTLATGLPLAMPIVRT